LSELVLDIETMRCGKPSYVDAKDATKLPDGAIEHPACMVAGVRAELNDAIVICLDRCQELAARGTHCAKTLPKFRVAIDLAKLSGQKLAHL